MSKWYCHCCRYKNEVDATKCQVCGRDESYAQVGHVLPLHGAGSKLYRPSQLSTIITEEGLFEKDSVQWTALHSAAVNGNYKVAEELIKRGCLIDAVTDQGQTALHLAVYSGSLDTVQVLIQNGSSVNSTTRFEKLTPLHLACQRDWKQIAKCLLDSGADTNAGNVIDRTPLHFVAQTGRTDLGVMLLKAGADSQKMDSMGWTPRQVAEFHEQREMQELLVQVNMKDKQVVIKKLPPAPWHSELWDATIRINKELKVKADRDMEISSRLMSQVESWQHRQHYKPERQSRIDSISKNDDSKSDSFSNSMTSSPARPNAYLDRNPSTRSSSVLANHTSSIAPFSRNASISTEVSSLTGSLTKSPLKVRTKAKLLTAAANRVLGTC
jgi:ankyrin repeat protein